MQLNKVNEDDMRMLRCIETYVNASGYAPTIKECCTLMGVKSKSTIFNRLKRLEKFNFITREPNSPRTMRLTTYGREVVMNVS